MRATCTEPRSELPSPWPYRGIASGASGAGQNTLARSEGDPGTALRAEEGVPMARVSQPKGSGKNCRSSVVLCQNR